MSVSFAIRVGQAFDFSFKYGACLCSDHYHEDERRCHLNPNIPYLLNQFQAIDFETLETISLKPEIKQELRQVYGSTLRRVRWDSPKIKEIY